MITVTPHEDGLEVVTEGEIGDMLQELLWINVDVLKHIYVDTSVQKIVPFERFVHEIMDGMAKDIIAYIAKKEPDA